MKKHPYIRAYPLSLILFGSLLISCTKSGGDGASIRIRFPEAESFANQGPKAAAVSANLLCFSINVTGDGITPAKSGQCDIPRGITAGSVAPGGEVSLEVPRGTKRRLEVFAFQRANATDPCPSFTSGFPATSLRKISRIGLVPDFATQEAEVTVNVDITFPDGTSNLITQYNLPNSCAPVSLQPSNTPASAPLFSSAVRTGTGTGGYIVRSGVGAPVGNHTATGPGGWKVKLFLKGAPQ